MADWLPGIGLLSESALQGVDEATQKKLQSEATGRFLLGSLLSGRPDIGFQSAIGTASDYATSQARLLDLAEKQRAQQAEDTWAAKYNPTKYQETSPEYMGPVTPAVSSYQTGIAQARAAGMPTADVNAALRDLTVLRSPRQAAMLEGFKASLPKVGEGGTMTSPGGQYLGTVPQFSPQQGIVYGTRVDSLGNIVPFSQEIPGAVETRGKMTEAEKAGAAKFELKPVIENGQEVLRPVYELSGADKKAALDRANGDVAGLKREIALTKPTETNRLAILNQELQKAQGQVASLGGTSAPVSKLSAPEAAYQGGWEKIRDNAYKNYEIASGRSGTLQSLQNIMNRPDFDTNAFTNYKTQLTSVLNASGIANDKQKQFLNSAAGFRQGLNTIAAQSVSELSGSTSNFDLEFSQNRFATITDPKQANQYAIDLLAASDARKKAFYNYVQENRTPDVIQKWQQTEQGKASIFESPSMRKYLPASQVTDGPYKGQTAYKMPDGTVKVFPK